MTFPVTPSLCGLLKASGEWDVWPVRSDQRRRRQKDRRGESDPISKRSDSIQDRATVKTSSGVLSATNFRKVGIWEIFLFCFKSANPTLSFLRFVFLRVEVYFLREEAIYGGPWEIKWGEGSDTDRKIFCGKRVEGQIDSSFQEKFSLTDSHSQLLRYLLVHSREVHLLPQTTSYIMYSYVRVKRRSSPRAVRSSWFTNLFWRCHGFESQKRQCCWSSALFVVERKVNFGRAQKPFEVIWTLRL